MPEMTSLDNLEVSVVIPCFKSPSSLEILIEELFKVGANFHSFEVILVIDGVRENQHNSYLNALKSEGLLKIIRLTRNFGQHNAIYAGICLAQNKLIVTMDDDSQHIPQEILKLVSVINDEIDVVYGTTSIEEHRYFRSLASRLVKRILVALGVTHASRISAFKAFRRDLIMDLGEIQNPFIQIDVLLGWTTSRIESVTVNMNSRKEGVSNYRISSLITYAYNLLTGYTIKPLRIISYAGILSCISGFGLTIYAIFSYFLSDKSPSGFTFIAASVSLFSGIQLLSLGVICEYLGRIFSRTSGQPTFRAVK